MSAWRYGPRPTPRWPLAVALCAGALVPLAFAPFNAWPLAIASPAAMMWLWQDLAPRRAALLGGCFGVGMFATGTWWLYISIHDFGPAPMWLAAALVLVLVLCMASYYALLGWLVGRLLPARGRWRWYAGLPALWLLVEWWRGWFVTGFPWLSLGYAPIDTWLAGYAPVVGVYGLSAVVLLQSGALVALSQERGRARWVPIALVAALWALGLGLARTDWTHPNGPAATVAVLQGAIPQDEKWQLNNREPTMSLYHGLNDQALGARLIVWPEAAIPELANEIPRFLADIQASARGHDSDVVMGVVREDDNGVDFYNSILALTTGVAFYDKRHLVPFAEYFPVPPFVRSWLRFMSLPYSDFTAGSSRPTPLRAGGMWVAPSICYEDAFGSAQLNLAARSELLVNVTNDAWFGRSPARYQHLQISRMRALETGRFMLRAGNNGVSAIIGPQGQIVALAPEYQSAVLRGTVVPRGGLSPYIRVGNWPVLLLAFGAAGAAGLRRRYGSAR